MWRLVGAAVAIAHGERAAWEQHHLAAGLRLKDRQGRAVVLDASRSLTTADDAREDDTESESCSFEHALSSHRSTVSFHHYF
jgi:hypothetical protein